MGRAIVTGGTDGLYTGAVQFDTRNADIATAAIDAEISRIDQDLVPVLAKISEIDAQLDVEVAEYNAETAEYNQAIDEYLSTWGDEKYNFPHWDSKSVSEKIAEVKASLASAISFSAEIEIDLTGNREYMVLAEKLKSAPQPLDQSVADAYNDLLAAAAGVHSLMNQKISVEKYRDMLLFRQEALRKRKARLEEAIDSTETREMWCADLSEDLAGEVDTLEVIGAPTQILVQPGGESNLKDESGTAGKLANIMSMSPAGAGLAWALLPGWQKWRPTYRVGTIHSIDYDADTASVNLDEAISIAQDLPIDQEGSLDAIPIEYMECNADAFLDGDRVVVAFPGQLWDQGPKVIGFETNPQACPGYSAIVGNTAGVSSFDDPNIFEWQPGMGTGEDPGVTEVTIESEVPEDTGDYNNAWKRGATVKIGVSWQYPFEFVSKKQFTMRLIFKLILYGEGGSVIAIIPIQLDYGPSGFTAQDKCVGRWNGGTFTANFNDTEYSSYSINYDLDCPMEIYGQIVLYADFYGFPYRVTGLNSIPNYNLTVGRTFYTWVHSVYQSARGIYAGANEWIVDGWSCTTSSCANPGIKCPTQDDTPVQDYLDLADPLDQVVDKAQLYVTQSWSMEGTIEEDGVTLTDSMSELTVGGHTIPFGPFAPVNATVGQKKLTSTGPISGVHHVGWSVGCLNTVAGTATAIAEQTYSGGSWGPRSIYSREFGYVQFYGIVEKPGRK